EDTVGLIILILESILSPFVAYFRARVRTNWYWACYQSYRWYLANSDSVNARTQNTRATRRARCGSVAQAPRARRRFPPRHACAAARRGAQQGARIVQALSEARLHDRDRKLARAAGRTHRVYDASAADGRLSKPRTCCPPFPACRPTSCC